MTDKGATGPNVFKLTVKVDLQTKGKVSKNALQKLQKIFEKDITHLHQHFQGYRELQSQHVHHVIQEKKRLGFEFWLKSAKELEQLWAATKDDSLAKALSEYSERKKLHIDIGLSSKQLCFKCKIERKLYQKGLEHFPEDSSESSDEESEEADSSSEETLKVKQIDSFFEPSNSNGTSVSVEHSNQTGDKEAEQLRLDQQKLSANAGTFDVSGSERGPQLGTTQIASEHGGDEAKTSGATQTQTGSSIDVVSFVQGTGHQQASNQQSSGPQVDQEKLHSQLLYPEQQLDLEQPHYPEQSQQNYSRQQPHGTGAQYHQTEQPQTIEKQLYLYLPFESKDIKEVLASVSCGHVHQKETFNSTKDDNQLWENQFTLHLDGSHSNIICEITVHKTGWRATKESKSFSLSSSVIQRLDWNGATTKGIATHVEHILMSCRHDVKSSCMQIEDLGYSVAAKTPNDKVPLVKSMEKELLSDDQKVLMFAILVAKIANDEKLEEFDKNIITLLSNLKNTTVQKLSDVVCSSASTSLPSSSVKCLKKLSYWVLKKIHGDNFCLVLWKDRIQYLNVDDFLGRIHQNVNIVKEENSESVEIVMRICSQIRDMLLSEECQNYLESLLFILKQLTLAIHMHIYMKLFNQFSETEIHVDRYVKDSLLKRIMGYKLKCKNDDDIQKLKNLWDYVKEAKLGREHNLILKFEDHVLELWQASSSQHHDNISPNWCALCEDEILFAVGENQTSLLNSMAKSSRKAMHGYMLNLAEMKKFKPGINFYIVQTWFDTAISGHNTSGRPVDYLVSWYCILGRALNLLEIPKEKEELGNQIYNKIKAGSLKASDLLKCEHVTEISQKLGPDNPVISVIKQHAVKLLKEKHGSENPENILNEMGKRGKSGLLLQEEWQADTVITLLELFPPRGNSDQDKFMSMLSHHAFWKAIFDLKGKYLDKVLKHESFKSARHLVSVVTGSFAIFSVQVAFVEQLALNSLEEKVAILLMKDSFSREQFHFIFKQCKECLNMEKVNLNVTKSTIESVLRFCPEARNLKSRLDTINKELQAGKVLIKDLKNIWNPFHALPKVCTKLKVPVRSKIFWKICKKNGIVKAKGQQTVEGESASSDLGEEKNREVRGTEDILSQSCTIPIQFLNLLSEEGCDLYRTFWENLFQGKDVCLSTIQEIHGTDISQEIELVEEYEGKQLDATSKLALDNYINFKKFENTVEAMIGSMSAFNVSVEDDEKFKNAIKAFQSLSKGELCSLSLFEVHNALMTVTEASNMLSDEAVDMLIALNSASSLLGFLSEVVDEDLTNWIDAVEEVFETYVKESTVSGLIEVKRFLEPFLEKDSKLREHPREFFNTFAVKLKSFKQLVGKVEDCMLNLHSLKSLYKNLANRSEGRREIIKNIVGHGSFNFSLENHQCILTVTYRQKDSMSKYAKVSLVDLRSSALLLMHTARKDDPTEESEDKQEYLGKFVTYMDLSLEIAELCTNLHVAGHIQFIEFKQQLESKSLNDWRLSLKKEFKSWQKDLKQCRKEYYYMNFLNGNQIQSLYSYLTDHVKNKKVVKSFLRFIHPLATIEGIRDYFSNVASDKSSPSVLMNMGKALKHACQNLTPIRRPIDLSESAVRFTESVQKGKLLIALLEENNDSVVKAVLGLYQINSKSMPEAHQVLFCRHETTWDELELILQRCLGAPKFGCGNSLFCLANVEMLSNEKQFQLVDALRKLPKDGAFCLALIFRGPEHHAFLHEFSECVTRIQPMTPASLEMCLQKRRPDVFTVTSHIPGLGKTEQVKRYANEINKKCITFHVSGPFRKQALVERLSELTLTEGCVLHIDVGNTHNPEELDVFLFELLVFQYVSTCTASVFLSTDTVRIEIANTMNNTLSDALHTVTSFKRHHLEWKGFETLKISSEVHSPVQVVCHYLDALKNGTIDTRDIIFKGTKALRPLSPEKCRLLLEKTFTVSKDEVSYTHINVFVRVLADQLKKLSCSGFF